VFDVIWYFNRSCLYF